MKSLTVVLLLTSLMSCASVSPNDPPLPVKKRPGRFRSPTSEEKAKKIASIDKTQAAKVNMVFSSVLVNDDKKAKLAYGRNHRHIPESVQFAMDIRFKNYEHALQILDKAVIPTDDRAFWKKILEAKPTKLVPVVCQELKNYNGVFKLTAEQEAWNYELESLVDNLMAQKSKEQPVSELDKEISKLQCDDESWTIEEGKCQPISKELLPKLFSEPFFDKFRNWHRRDIRFVKENFRNYMKVREYNRYVSVNNILRFYRAASATQDPKQSKYIRRFKGVGREMRRENLVSRLMGDYILEDKENLVLTEKLMNFVQSYPIVNLAVGFEFELAPCELPPDPPPTQSSSADQ